MKANPSLIFLVTVALVGFGVFAACAFVEAGADAARAQAHIQAVEAARDRAERLVREFSPCAAPQKEGDRTMIMVRHDGAHLVVTCNRVPTWRDPARALR